MSGVYCVQYQKGCLAFAGGELRVLLRALMNVLCLLISLLLSWSYCLAVLDVPQLILGKE